MNKSGPYPRHLGDLALATHATPVFALNVSTACICR